jgi:hypothetical protein
VATTQHAERTGIADKAAFMSHTLSLPVPAGLGFVRPEEPKSVYLPSHKEQLEPQFKLLQLLQSEQGPNSVIQS